MTEPQATTSGQPAISFGPFRPVTAQRLLLEGDKPVRMGSRAFDILTALVDPPPLRDPGLMPSAVATVLSREIRTEDPLPALAAAFRLGPELE
jgi:hypothetical protein